MPSLSIPIFYHSHKLILGIFPRSLDVPKDNVVRITANNTDDILAENIGLNNFDLIKNVIE